MVLDTERHRADKMKYLEALYSKESEYLEQDAGRQVGGFRMPVTDVGRLAGLDDHQAERITSDLKEEGSVNWTKPLTGTGSVWLTKAGREAAEKHLYEKSALGKRRKLVGLLKEKAKEAGKWLGGIIIGALGTSYGPEIVEWLKGLLGIK